MDVLDWTKIERFKPSEFSEDPTIYSNPQTIRDLDKFRYQLGKGITPSKANGAVARIDGNPTTRHYAVDRKSDALDIFCSCRPEYAYNVLLSCRLFNGIGVYFDTRDNLGLSHVMFHIDQRPLKENGLPTIWYRKDGKYVYQGSNPESFFIKLTALLSLRETL